MHFQIRSLDAKLVKQVYSDYYFGKERDFSNGGESRSLYEGFLL